MSMTYVEGLPDLPDLDEETPSVAVSGGTAMIRYSKFLARVWLESSEVDWVIDCSRTTVAGSGPELPRFISLSGPGPKIWFSEQHQIVAEILSAERGGVIISARNSSTGTLVWELSVSNPNAADWAEPAPAWPGATTEEIDAFFANDPDRLIVCLARNSRRQMISTPTYSVTTIPPFDCQSDMIRLDPSKGTPVWQSVFPDVPVQLIERCSFTGIWSNNSRLGAIDFESGTNTVLHEFPNSLGWPVHDGPYVAVHWHSRNEVGVEWIDNHGRRIRNGVWKQPRATATYLHPTEAGLAIQTSPQSLSWLGTENLPQWNVLAKPYIYRVHRATNTDIFVGTDGNGGRLLAFDADSGCETLNLKPVLGGVGNLVKATGHNVLVSTFRVSKSYSKSPRLLVVSMNDRRHWLDDECEYLLGTWKHGVICKSGRNGERLAIFDVRDKIDAATLTTG